MRIFSKSHKRNIKITGAIMLTAFFIFTAFTIQATARNNTEQHETIQSKTAQVATTQVGTAQSELAPLQLYAHAAVLMDADSGRILYGKNETEVLPMASTTKIMTCILALEYGNLDDIIEVSDYAASMPKVKLYMKPGEKYRLGDLLYSLMLESHNDSAVAIAEAVGGSIEKFAVMMNQKARDIGCYDTYFITPNGLDAVVNNTGKIHSTTAADLAKIMAYCVLDSAAKDEFLTITQTREYAFQDADGRRSIHCSNHNSFLSMMDEAVSGKTGFTNKAGYCYVGAVESEGRTFTVALLACGWPNHKTYKWSDMKKLADYGMANYEYRDIYEEKQFEAVPVVNGIAGEDATPYEQAYAELALEADAPRNLPYLLCADDVVEVKTSLMKRMNAPVYAGESAGRISYYLNGELVEEYEVISTQEVAAQNYPWTFRYVLQLFLPM